MSTKIELRYPYNEKWKSGYLNINPEGRRTLSLYNSHKDRSSTQYARYLMAIYLGRFLEQDEHVDHIDNDKTNDNISNLQILTLAENNIKSNKKPDIHLVCPICMKAFSGSRKKLGYRVKEAIRKNRKVCCSRSCRGKYSHIKNNGQ